MHPTRWCPNPRFTCSHVHMFCMKDRLSTMIKLQRCLWKQVLLWCCFGGRRRALVSALPPISPSLFFLILSPSLPACKYTALHWLYMCMHIYLFLTNQSSTYVCIYKYVYIYILSPYYSFYSYILYIYKNKSAEYKYMYMYILIFMETFF